MPFSKLTSKGNECDDVEDEAHKKKLDEEKAKRRLVLREQFLKEKSDPFIHASGDGGTVFDPAVQRYISMKSHTFEHFRPSVSNAFTALSCIIFPMVTFGYFLNKMRTDRERSFRTGKVAYKDRLTKFV